MITNKDEAKAMTEHISCDSIVQHVIQIKNEIIRHVNINFKNIISAKKIIVTILTHVYVEIISM